MTQSLIALPVLMQVSLTLMLYVALGIAKSRATKRGEVNEDRRALHDDAWPDSVQKINNNIRNQFEVPVLFYVTVFVLWGLEAVDMTALILAWGFVASRLVHAYIHTGSNYVPLRRRVFSIGVILVIALTGLCVKAALF